MFSAREHLKKRLESLNEKLSDELDFDFSSVSKKIDTYEEFEKYILNDFLCGKQLFYRGERINDPNRHLIPTMFRKPKELFKDNDLGIVHIDSHYLYNYYAGMGSFVDVFNKTMGKADVDNMYEICAFAQHYCDFSPLIDFTKSLYPSLSFALKDRTEFDDDIILYVLELKDFNDYTNDISVANQWLKDFSVYVSCIKEDDIKKAVRDIFANKHILPMPDDFRKHLEHIGSKPVPKAKLIDVPTNTRMKFQQGVFLLLTDFHLFNVTYFTKNIREQFSITKYIISKDICLDILDMINRNASWYSYKYLMDVEGAFKKAIENETE